MKSIQAYSFGNETGYLKQKECITEPKYVKQFGLYLDEREIVCCRGRTGNSTLSLTVNIRYCFLQDTCLQVHRPSQRNTRHANGIKRKILDNLRA